MNFSYPRAKLKDETIKLAKKLMEKSPAVLRYTKEALRAVRLLRSNRNSASMRSKDASSISRRGTTTTSSAAAGLL